MHIKHDQIVTEVQKKSTQTLVSNAVFIACGRLPFTDKHSRFFVSPPPPPHLKTHFFIFQITRSWSSPCACRVNIKVSGRIVSREQRTRSNKCTEKLRGLFLRLFVVGELSSQYKMIVYGVTLLARNIRQFEKYCVFCPRFLFKAAIELV